MVERKFSGHIPGLIAFVAVAGLYLATLQWVVNGSAGPGHVLEDVGEIQVALNTWGTIHATGYPLYTILGNLFVLLLRAFGAGPAAAASAYALAWGLITLALSYGLIWYLTRDPLAASLAALSVGVVRAFWLHSVVAEVYTMSTAFIPAILLVAAIKSPCSGARAAALGFLLGAGAAHHRLIILLAPGALLLLWPNIEWWGYRRPLRLGLVGALSFGLGFLPYLYLPLRAWQGAPWLYGSPGTWNGFWHQFMGKDIDWVGAFFRNSRLVAARLRVAGQEIIAGTNLLLVLLSLAAILYLLLRGRWRRFGLAIAILCVLFYLFMAFLAACMPIATAMHVMVLLGLPVGVALADIGQRTRAGKYVLGLVILALGAFVASQSWGQIKPLTQDRSGPRFIELVKRTPAGEGSIFMAPWGSGYFAAAYAVLVSGEIQGLRLVDHNANLGSLVDSGWKLYTTPDTFYVFPLGWWDTRLGRARLSSPAPGIIRVGREPEKGWEEVKGQPLGNGMEMLAHRLDWNKDSRELILTVWWRMTNPTGVDYSVYVHVSDKEAIKDSADILAQGDQRHPVYGWYPTSRWSSGEVVQDHYSARLPEGAWPRLVRIGMYRQDPASGSFQNFGNFSLPVEGN